MSPNAPSAVAVLWIFTLVIDAVVVFPLIASRFDAARWLVVALLFGQTALASVWMALGGAATALRAAIWVAVVTGSGLGFSYVLIPVTETLTVYWSLALGVTFCCALLRGTGLRWTVHAPVAPEENALAGNQFSLAHLLGWTTVLALLAFASRFADFPDVQFAFVASIVVFSGLLSVATAWVAAARQALLLQTVALLTASLLVGPLLASFEPEARGKSLMVSTLFVVQTLFLLLWFGVTRAYDCGIHRVASRSSTDT